MKRIYLLLLIIFGIVSLPSCLVEDEVPAGDNDKGPNLAGFEKTRTTLAGIADGTAYDFDIKVNVIGPTSMDLTNDVTLSIEADPASTAIEGTHYQIDNPTVTLTSDNNYLGFIGLTMLTEGVETPLEEAPVLILNVKSATGDENVINNGKPIEITFNFACFSSFEGEYSVVTTSSSGTVREWQETITKIGTEEYLTQRVGTWNPPLNPDYGFVFTNACNVLTVPNQGLADMYSNDVYSHSAGSYDPETGVITIYYTIWFEAGDNTYTAVYTPL